MRRIAIVFFFCLLAGVGLRASEPGTQLYLDLGPASERDLTSETKNELLSLIESRISDLDEALSEPELFHQAREEAYEQQLRELRSFKRWRACAAAGLCGLVGGAVGFMGFEALLQLQTPVSPLAHAMSFVMGINASFMAGAVGYAVVDSRYPHLVRQARVELDQKSEEVLNVAKEISAEIYAMAVPLNFWTIRRFHDFNRKYAEFKALEELVKTYEMNLQSEVGQIFARSRHYSRLKDLEWSRDVSEAELGLRREKALRSLRRLERGALTYVFGNIEEVDHPYLKIDWRRLSERQCLQALRLIMSGDLKGLMSQL